MLETQVWPPTHEGFIKTCIRECSLELCMSISFEARFIINRVSRVDYRIPILCLTKPLKCVSAFSYTHPPTHPPKHRHKLKVKYIRHCCILHWRCWIRKKNSFVLTSSKLWRTIEVCSHQGLEWAGICWYRMSALYVKQYNADWDVHTSASTLPAYAPPPTPPSALYKGVPLQGCCNSLHKKQFDTFWFQHKYIQVGDNCGLKVASYSAQSTTTLMLKKKSLNIEIKKATLQGKKKKRSKPKKGAIFKSLC